MKPDKPNVASQPSVEQKLRVELTREEAESVLCMPGVPESAIGRVRTKLREALASSEQGERHYKAWICDTHPEQACACLNRRWVEVVPANHPSSQPGEPFCVIDAEEFEKARHDPNVIAFAEAADRYLAQARKEGRIKDDIRLLPVDDPSATASAGKGKP